MRASPVVNSDEAENEEADLDQWRSNAVNILHEDAPLHDVGGQNAHMQESSLGPDQLEL